MKHCIVGDVGAVVMGGSADVRLGVGRGGMVSSFQHLQLECAIRAGPTSAL